MILPIFIHSEPDKCPKCHNVENKKEVCRNCNFEYKDEDMTFGEVLFGCVGVLVGVVVFSFVMLVFTKFVIGPMVDLFF